MSFPCCFPVFILLRKLYSNGFMFSDFFNTFVFLICSADEAFFKSVIASGSEMELKDFLTGSKQEEKTRLASSFNSKGETPLIVVIKGEHYDKSRLVRYLVTELKASTCQFGRFTWKELDFKQLPPLCAAILCDDSDNMAVIDFLIDQDLANNSTPECVAVITSSSLTEFMKANMLKLLGAVYVLKEFVY